MARGNFDAEFKWNYPKTVIMKNKGYGSGINRAFAEALYEFMTPLTPKKTGYLRDAVEIGSDNKNGWIHYLADYSAKQYEGPDDDWNRTTEGTTSAWDVFAWTLYKEQIVDKVDDYRKRHSK